MEGTSAKFCDFCQQPFESIVDLQKFCNPKCRKAFGKKSKINQCFSKNEPVAASEPSATLPSTSRSLRMDGALENIGNERLEELFAVGARYSESTLKKHIWVEKLYVGFAKVAEFEPWPLEPRSAAGFIRFLGLEAKYAVGSIEDVVIPSLKRMHKEKMDTVP